MVFEKRYVFTAHAVGAAAHIRRFKEQPVEVDTTFEGSAALPATGGSLRSTSARREVRHEKGFILSFDSASATVNGDYTDPQAAFEQTQGKRPGYTIPARAVCAASVGKLNVQNRLLIDNLECHLSSTDPRNHGQIVFSNEKPQVVLGVVVDQHPLTVELDEVFLHLGTKKAIEDEYQHSAAFRKEYGARFYRTDSCQDCQHNVPQVKNYIVASVVKSLHFDHGQPAGAEISGNMLTLPEFGKMFFGEIIIGEMFRRLTLLRLQLGSDWGGDGGFCESKPNGEGMP